MMIVKIVFRGKHFFLNALRRVIVERDLEGGKYRKKYYGFGFSGLFFQLFQAGVSEFFDV